LKATEIGEESDTPLPENRLCIPSALRLRKREGWNHKRELVCAGKGPSEAELAQEALVLKALTVLASPRSNTRGRVVID